MLINIAELWLNYIKIDNKSLAKMYGRVQYSSKIRSITI